MREILKIYTVLAEEPCRRLARFARALAAEA
jgi:hypothetical protein